MNTGHEYPARGEEHVRAHVFFWTHARTHDGPPIADDGWRARRPPRALSSGKDTSCSPIRPRSIIRYRELRCVFFLSLSLSFFIFFIDRPTPGHHVPAPIYISLSLSLFFDIAVSRSLFVYERVMLLSRSMGWWRAFARPFIPAGELDLRLLKSRIMFPAFVRGARTETFEYAVGFLV